MDVLRGLLASWVVLHHVVLLGSFDARVYPWRVFMHHGQEPVLVFFILSGFAITRSLCARPQRWTSFMIARFWRIYPVYLIALAIGAGVVGYAGSNPSVFGALQRVRIVPWAADEGLPRWLHMALHSLQLHGLVPSGWLPYADTSLVAPGWSLSTEFQFYMLAPLLGVILLRPGRLSALAPGTIMIVAGLSFYFFDSRFVAPANVLRYLDLFILGAIGASLQGAAFTQKLGYSLLAALVAAAGWHAGHIIVVTAICVWLVFWWCSAVSPIDRLIDTPLGRLMLFVGALSYPLYILHYPLARLLLIIGAQTLPAARPVFLAAWVPASIVLSYVAAAMLHRRVELPGTRYGKLVAARFERRPGFVRAGHRTGPIRGNPGALTAAGSAHDGATPATEIRSDRTIEAAAGRSADSMRDGAPPYASSRAVDVPWLG